MVNLAGSAQFASSEYSGLSHFSDAFMATIVFGPVPPVIRPPRALVALARSLHLLGSIIHHVGHSVVEYARRIDAAGLWDAGMSFAARLLLTLAVSAPDDANVRRSARHSW